MAELKIFGRTIGGKKKSVADKKPVVDTRGGYEYTDEDKGMVPRPGGYEYTPAEWDEIRDRSASTKPTTLKNEKYNPVKITKKEVSVEGDRGTVDRTSDVIGPDMGKVVKEVVKEKEMDLQEKARKSMGFKKGGKVKSKSTKMASGGKASQLAKANGIAVRGKSRGRII
jgi:hypothetical protein